MVELEPRFVLHPSFSSALEAWKQNEVDALAGITLEESIAIRAHALPPYRTVGLQALISPQSLISREDDLSQVLVLALPEGIASLYARTRGWNVMEVASEEAAWQRIRQNSKAAFLCVTNPPQQSQEFQTLSLRHESAVSLALSRSSPYSEALTSGFHGLIRSGYDAQLRRKWQPSREPDRLALDAHLLAGAMFVLVAAMLVFAQEQATRIRVEVHSPANAGGMPSVPPGSSNLR